MTVGLVIVSHSAQLAAGVAELATQMTQGATPIAPAGGAANDVLGTSVDKILAAIQAVDGPGGVLILLDLGSAILSTEMALEMLEDDQREHIALSFAPLVEGTLAASIEASLGRTLAEVKAAAEKTAQPEQLQMLKPLSSSAAEDANVLPPSSELVSQPTAPTYLEAQLVLTNPTGLHARPASLFVQTAHRFQASIQALGRGKQAEATSIIGVLSLGVRQGDTLTIRASGAEAAQALDALSTLVHANFYETPAETTAPSTSLPDKATASQPPAPLPTAAPESWQGVSISPGIALGPAFLYTSHKLTLSQVERQHIAGDQVPSEQERLRQAVNTAVQELHALTLNIQQQVGQAEAAIFDAQALMLQDPALLEAALQQVQDQHLTAASALAIVGEQQASVLEALDDPLLAARAVDVRDAVGRTLQHLTHQPEPQQSLSALDHPVILLAQDLTPSDTSRLRPENVLGISTVQGGPTAHTAILARALGIPAMAGLSEGALTIIQPGDELGLDADHGLLYHRPSQEMRTQLTQRLNEYQQQRAALKASAQQKQVPVDIEGRHISLLANIGSEAEAQAAREWGAEGIGLLRTEFLFAQASELPAEDEQRRRYVQIFQAFRGDRAAAQTGPIVVRTLDAGADKPLPALKSILGASSEANPALGLRGIRISLAHRVLLEQQLTALILAAVDTGIQLHIMFPMIATVEESREARSVFTDIYARLKQRSIALPAHISLGIMVEVPSAVAMAAELAEIADFFSIGANDLLQYTLACDRTNATTAYLYHPMQPAVLRFIAQVAAAGRRAGKPVAVCGEIASDVRLAPVLVGLGVDELSMTPTAIPAVRAALAHRTTKELSALAQRVLQSRTVSEVEQACNSI
jgi:phosphoenolpyruvate-protein phosphotransferase/dihydroxyacetone kinase phosphotransfer subunit